MKVITSWGPMCSDHWHAWPCPKCVGVEDHMKQTYDEAPERQNWREIANHYHLAREDYDRGVEILGTAFASCDLVISPDGAPYLYRWHVIPHNRYANVYLHLQVRPDPERPLHDHPWDNQSVILAGGYDELISRQPGTLAGHRESARVGETITRKAEWPHRLLMPDGVPYTMTLFSTGPKRRRWGFWYPQGWVDAAEVCRQDGNISVHVQEGAK